MPEFIDPERVPQDRERARVATGDELAALLHHPSADVLLALLDNPALDEPQLCLLLERKDLPGELLEEVGSASRSSKAIGSSALFVFIPADRAWLLSG